MILPFKHKFVPKILNGTQIHAIRTDVFNRWKKGYLINMATDVRTPNYNEFKRCVCCGIQSIIIEHDFVIIDNRTLDFTEVTKLAHNEGFDTLHDFYKWFNKPFVGKIIHWTNLRY